MNLSPELRTWFAENDIRLNQMVHFPLSGSLDMPASEGLSELLVYDLPEWLPEGIRAALGANHDDLDELVDFDEIADRLNEAGIDGWLIELSTPVRNYTDTGDIYHYAWSTSTSRWFYCPAFDALLPQARAWIAEMVTKWRTQS